MVGVRCAVAGCAKNVPGAHKDVSFFIVPKNSTRRKEWLKAIKKKCTKPTKLLVCELHFSNNDIVTNNSRKRVAPGAVPSLRLPSSYDPPDSPPKALSDKEIQVPEVKHEPMDFDNEVIIDLFTKEEPIISRNSTLEATEEPGTIFTLNGISLKRETTDDQDSSTAYEADDSFAVPPQVNDVPPRSKSTELDLLIKLSKAYLSPELAKVIEVQTLLKRELGAALKGKECNKAILFFALKLYHYFPQSYKVMQESLCLPSMLQLKELCRNMSWEIHDTWGKVVRARFERASAAERECVVCVARARLRLGLGYDAARDRLTGLDELDGGQRTRAARFATIVYARGILSRWIQPLSYSLLTANAGPDELWLWFDIIISKLFDVGLTVRAIVTDFDSEYQPTIRPTPADKSYFQVKNKQIYCFYDPTQLMVRFRDCFMRHNIIFRGMLASWEAIEELYDYDSTRRYKMGAGLTSEHVHPVGAAARRATLAVEALSPRVAAAVAAAVDLRVLDDSAHGTVQLITTFSTLYEILHSKELTATGNGNKITPEMKFLNDMLLQFERMTFVDKRTLRHVPEPGVLRAFLADVRAAMALQERLRRAGYYALPMRVFNNDPLHRFFDRARALNGDKDPTARELVDAFRRSFVLNIMKSFSANEGKLDVFLDMACGIRGVVLEPVDDSKITLVKGMVTPSHFAALLQPRVTTTEMARQVLRRAWRQHPCCEAGMGFSRSPPPAYDHFLCMMEQKFRLFFTTEFLGEGVLNSLLTSLAEEPFPSPCACFPVLYLKTLFLRFRLAKLVQYNNTKFERSISRDFTMNLLQF